MEKQITVITIEHGKMTKEEIDKTVHKMFGSIAGDEFDMNIISYNHKTNNITPLSLEDIDNRLREIENTYFDWDIPGYVIDKLNKEKEKLLILKKELINKDEWHE